MLRGINQQQFSEDDEVKEIMKKSARLQRLKGI